MSGSSLPLMPLSALLIATHGLSKREPHFVLRATRTERPLRVEVVENTEARVWRVQ